MRETPRGGRGYRLPRVARPREGYGNRHRLRAHDVDSADELSAASSDAGCRERELRLALRALVVDGLDQVTGGGH